MSEDKLTISQAPAAHAYNPSYLGGTIRRITDWSQSGQTIHKTLSQETLHKNRADGVAQGEGPEFKPQYRRGEKTT
jgi:hypothetical protein